MDEKFLEMASELEENMRTAAIANTAKDVRETHPDFDGAHCVRCEDPILPGRLAGVGPRLSRYGWRSGTAGASPPGKGEALRPSVAPALSRKAQARGQWLRIARAGSFDAGRLRRLLRLPVPPLDPPAP